eukprot:CAMPEP_0198324914 /NCGR_PEP_ID=MMETSP1450-20131203/12806_1 /TAXON_ID=753684 ORGANISM="Madagascaria erythrocladiodes, Strain CCMP3234" /NCGR_SAMPLE_ID=MMETSP1450 /ASSEMBLY_ACC=CAM_ASM_001115 /LENGTH=270 /DNA_ID=CAMNT_0044028747 /DNA_START=31 /DNA_END=843 /DNA_ORIENTATION=+
MAWLVRRFFDEFPEPDPRVAHWPLFSSWLWGVAPPVGYLLSVVLLRRFMRTRRAFEVPLWFQALHNLFLVLLSAYMAYGLFYEAVVVLGYGFVCNPLAEGERALPLARMVYIFTISKLYEFVDTWLMIVRKSDRQVTFLHVYHHATIYFVWWVNLRHHPGSEAFQPCFLNSCVHIIMYAYYFLRTVRPSGNYWWKKFITQGQIAQFSSFIVQGALIVHYECVPFSLGIFNELYAWTLFLLFANFYVQNYRKAPKARVAGGGDKRRAAKAD